jgi:hypothetical protein
MGVLVGVEVGAAVAVLVGPAVAVTTTGVLVGGTEVEVAVTEGVPVEVGPAVGPGVSELPTRNQSKSAGMAALVTAVFVPPNAVRPTCGAE